MPRPPLPPWMARAREFAARVPSPVGTPFAAAKKGKVCELYLYDGIGVDPWTDTGIDPKDIVTAVAEARGADELAVHINSPGGYVFDGIAIMNAIKSFSGRKTVYVDGVAASIASIIAMAGDRVVMNEGAMFMIHDPMAGILAMGTADQIEDEARKMCASLRKVRESLLDVYVTATGRPLAEISAWMAAETWMTADEARERGFADEVVKPAPAPEARATLSPDAASALARARVANLPAAASRVGTPGQPGTPRTAAKRST